MKEQFPAIPTDVLEEITCNGIDGETFIELNDEYLREIAPKLCDRIRMKKAVNMALTLTSPVRLRLIIISLKHEYTIIATAHAPCSTIQ